MPLTRNQFDVLTLIERESSLTQREMAELLKRSIGTINKTVTELRGQQYVHGKSITEEGLSALEPYRVRRAIIIAAGFGARLVPITLNTPKPLVRVNGTRIIDTMLDAIMAAGIQEIYIVRGYMAEQFDQLLYKYPNIKFIENPAYNETNNISSLMCVRYLLKNVYVFEGDLVLYNPGLVTKYQYSSNYLGVPVTKTDDWCLESQGGYITKLALGGTNCHHLYGISYWTAEDGARLAEHLKAVYESPGGKERYWDQVALEYYLHDYAVTIRECQFADIAEIDTYRELKQIDPTYAEA